MSCEVFTLPAVPLFLIVISVLGLIALWQSMRIDYLEWLRGKT